MDQYLLFMASEILFYIELLKKEGEMKAIYPSLVDRPVLITGGATGIGEYLVRAFSAQSARVAFVDIQAESAQSLVDELAGTCQHTPLFFSCDLRDITALRDCIATAAAAVGPFRALLNNAANDDRHRWQDVTEAYWDDRVAVNLRHQFFAAQAVAPMMAAAGGGSIINFGSVAWVMGMGGFAAYTASKSAVLGLTRGLARDLGPDGIRVNCLAPGWVMTERQKRLWLDEESRAELFRRQCLKRYLEPDHIAAMALFLAADDSALCTNQTYIVDGGWV